MITSESTSRLETVDNAPTVCLSEKPVAVEAERTSETSSQSDSHKATICVPEVSIALSQHTGYLAIVAFVFIGFACVFGITTCGMPTVAISSAFSAVVGQLNNLSSAAGPAVPKK